MDYKVLYRKYRPDDFSSIIGQDYMISILKNAIKKSQISHAYIFSGPRGTGKTSTAKVFAKAINCLNPTENGPCNACEACLNFKENADIIEMDAASNNGVDEIREIINNIKLAPTSSKYKVYIIDEVHMLSTSAFNALLLTLEEPPKHVVFILATTNIEAVPITILSRCQRFDFHKISLKDIINRLNYVVSKENIAIEPEALEEIAYISDGGLRDALSILDQLSSNTNKITIDDVISHFGSASKKQITDLYNCIITNNIDHFLNMMEEFKKLSIDYKLLIKKLLEKLEEEAINSKKEPNYQGLSYENIRSLAFELAQISNYININIDPYLLIQITILKYFHNTNEVKEIPKSEPKTIKEPQVHENIQEEPELKQPNINVNPSIDEKLINIRINNCFTNATKENLKKLQTMWEELINNADNNEILNLIVDTSVSAASDTYGILTSDFDETVSLINKNIYKIDDYFQEKMHLDYKFVALTKENWKKERNTYITNIKNKVEYKYIEEPKRPDEPQEEISNIEKTAYNLFDKEKIEIE